MNYLKALASDIHNEYLTKNLWEKIWTVVGPWFGYEQVKVMLVVKSLYGMKLSGATFRDILSEQLHDLGYRTSLADPYVYTRPSFQLGGFM